MDRQREKTRSLMQEIKGIGDLAVEIFFNNTQSVWPSIAPFVDSRSLKTADEVGIGLGLTWMRFTRHCIKTPSR